VGDRWVHFFLSYLISSYRIPSKQHDRIWKNKKFQCEKGECGSMIPDEAMNCVNNCTSPLCYQVSFSSIDDSHDLMTEIGGLWCDAIRGWRSRRKKKSTIHKLSEKRDSQCKEGKITYNHNQPPPSSPYYLLTSPLRSNSSLRLVSEHQPASNRPLHKSMSYPHELTLFLPSFSATRDDDKLQGA
jgi:hypothetical protein